MRTTSRTRFVTVTFITAAVFVATTGLYAVPAEAGTFPGQNGKIAYELRTSWNEDYTARIYLRNADGSSPVKLTDESFGDYLQMDPAWSADGSTIAFAHPNLGEGSSYPYIDTHLINQDGTDMRTIFEIQTEGYFNRLESTFSPDGTKVAFVGIYSNVGAQELYVADIDGTNQIQLTSLGYVMNPEWSPDGSRILFTVSEGGTTVRLYVVNADGTGLAPLTDVSSFRSRAVWSSDGTKIAYTGSVEKELGTGSDIFVMNADGTGQTRLTYTDSVALSPSWSPDGQKIVFSAYIGQFDLFTVNADGSDLTNITNTPGFLENEMSPAWQPLPVEPQTPAEQAEEILETIATLELPADLAESLNQNVGKVSTFIERDNAGAIGGQLTAFKSKLNAAVKNGKVDSADGQALIDAAEAILEELN